MPRLTHFISLFCFYTCSLALTRAWFSDPVAWDFMDLEVNPKGANDYLTGGSTYNFGKQSKFVNKIGAFFLSLLFITIFVELGIAIYREKRRVQA